MRILFYGDSNTFGFDPTSPLGERYDEQHRFPELMATPNRTILNFGQNGREIPRSSFGLQVTAKLIEEQSPVDIFVVMLGTNDLLNAPMMGAEGVMAKMSAFLEYLRVHLDASQILFIAPPAMTLGSWVPSMDLVMESKKLAVLYEAYAAEESVPFVDASAWDIPLASDGVHFTPEGHVLFAQKLNAVLQEAGIQ